MNKPNETINTAVVIQETTTFTVTEICQRCNLPYAFLKQMVEHGMFESQLDLEENFALDLVQVNRIESAFHLHNDLEINMPGIALVLELRDEIDHLQKELALLRNHLTK